MRSLSLAGIVFALGVSGIACADARPDHFKGEPAETFQEAVANFSAYNEKLAAILAKNTLEPADIVQIHELTYTLENALEKINEEFEDLADTLEEVHVASERLDAAQVRTQGEIYLDTARQVFP